MTIERGTQSGPNLALKSRSDWIWKNGFRPLAITPLHPAADRPASSALSSSRPQAAKLSESR